MLKIKRISKLICAILFSILTLHTPMAHAAGGSPSLILSRSSASTTVGSKITISAYVYWSKCPDKVTPNPGCSDGSTPTQEPIPNREVILVPSTGLTLGGTQTWHDGRPYVKTGSDGRVQFTVSAASAGTKQVSATFTEYWPDPANGIQSISVSFTAPPAPKPAPAPAPAPEPAPPAALQTSAIEVNGQPLADTSAISLESNQPLVLKGKTVPNGVVKLYIFSTPREASVTADAAGNWSYSVEGLEPGSHHIEAEVTDPATKKTSSRATLATFTVNEPKPAEQTQATNEDKRAGLPLWIFIVGGIVTAGLIALGVWLWRRHSANKKTPTPPSTQEPTPSSGSNSPQA